MNEHKLLERVVVSQDIAHGKPRIAGTRIMVHQVLDLLAGGLSITEIVGEDYFPDITPEDVLACVAYASKILQSNFFLAN